MKKILISILCATTLLSLFSCLPENKYVEESDTDAPSTVLPDNEHTSEGDNDIPTTVLSADNCYKIEEIAPFHFRYTIYDIKGNTVKTGETKNSPPKISTLTEHVLDISISRGTGLCEHVYYDIANDRFSEEYTYVAAASGNLIAYVDTSMEDPMINRTLVVRDIFDRSVFYKSFCLDFSITVDMPVEYAEFTENQAELQVIYLSERPPVPLPITLPILSDPTDGEILSEAEKAMKAYESVLKNEIKVLEIYSFSFSCIRDLRAPYSGFPIGIADDLTYAYTDLDSDGINELVINCGDTIILRYLQGVVYAYPFTFRQMSCLNTDGSYSWNHTGANFEYGENRILFRGAELTDTLLWRIVNDGTPNAEFYVGEEQVTKEELLSYVNNNTGTKVEFSPLDNSCLYPISSNKALDIASDHWGFKDGDIFEDAVGTQIVSRIEMIEYPVSDSAFYRIAWKLEYYNTSLKGWEHYPPSQTETHQILLVNAMTGECTDVVDKG